MLSSGFSVVFLVMRMCGSLQYLPHWCTRVVSIAEWAGVKIYCTLWTRSVTVLTWHHRSAQCLLTDRAAQHFIQRNHQLFHLTCLETTGTWELQGKISNINNYLQMQSLQNIFPPNYLLNDKSFKVLPEALKSCVFSMTS